MPLPRVRLVHWKAAEAGPLLDSLRQAGYAVDYDPDPNYRLAQAIRAAPPVAVVIDLSRLPSHGREIGVFLRGSKSTRQVPLVFVNGLPEKVEMVRQQLPDAVYTTTAGLPAGLRRAIAEAPHAPLVPRQMMERYGTRTAAQKLGIKANAKVAVFDPPRDYVAVLGELPAGASLEENGAGPCEVSLWFVHNVADYHAALPAMRKLAAAGKLWILWRKQAAGGKPAALNERVIREAAIAMGLVDYKVCAVDVTWSALAFAAKAVSAQRTSR